MFYFWYQVRPSSQIDTSTENKLCREHIQKHQKNWQGNKDYPGQRLPEGTTQKIKYQKNLKSIQRLKVVYFEKSNK